MLNKLSDLLNLNKISKIGYKIFIFVYKISYLSNNFYFSIIDILFVNVIKISYMLKKISYLTYKTSYMIKQISNILF